ncbi:MAG: hypothetical protein GC191_20440, partial [Azospirillum sp.]|nr:hypothetical protein [Azospirillum sp.]
MGGDDSKSSGSFMARVEAEIADSFDEELEMEIDDDRLAELLERYADHPDTKTVDRHFYFKELFRLQSELVKLQAWVVAQKLKVVVLFEGRDAAGKGGVIKRITQRLNPRVCRVVALPAPTDRERSQWYFQPPRRGEWKRASRERGSGCNLEAILVIGSRFGGRVKGAPGRCLGAEW